MLSVRWWEINFILHTVAVVFNAYADDIFDVVEGYWYRKSEKAAVVTNYGDALKQNWCNVPPSNLKKSQGLFVEWFFFSKKSFFSVFGKLGSSLLFWASVFSLSLWQSFLDPIAALRSSVHPSVRSYSRTTNIEVLNGGWSSNDMINN